MAADKAGAADDEDVLVSHKRGLECDEPRFYRWRCERPYGSSVTPAALGAMVPMRWFSDCALFSNSAA